MFRTLLDRDCRLWSVLITSNDLVIIFAQTTDLQKPGFNRLIKKKIQSDMDFFLKNNYIIFIHSVNSPNLWPESWPVLYVHKYIGIIEKTRRDQINTLDCEVFYCGFKQCLSPESLLISR
jgi:hypothetical protein